LFQMARISKCSGWLSFFHLIFVGRLNALYPKTHLAKSELYGAQSRSVPRPSVGKSITARC
jgi:hypothetical protein